MQCAAAFGRLCVETYKTGLYKLTEKAAAFGRLCVETLERYPASLDGSAAAFGRLCVETSNSVDLPAPYESSRLRAAVC